MTATADSRRSEEYVGEEMTLVEHLQELRSRLFKSAAAIVVGFVVGFIFRDHVLELLQRPYCNLPSEIRAGAARISGDAECSLLVLRVLDPFVISLKAAAVVAVVIAAPVVCYQLLRFVAPGLRPMERRYSIPFVVASQVLFAGGAVFSFFLIPRALEFLLGFAGPSLTPVLSGNEYLSFILQVMIAFGVSFEFPLVLMILSLMGVVTSKGLRRWRRQAIFGTFVAAAIITPTQDPLTMTMMAAPLVLFYEFSVLFAWFVERRRARAEATLGA
ncbi:MAG: twin-arginine translocase subunit TatC [Nitriliruptorales bacterium]|nr:twin-arginine translocase subunit TatC [Nitriliruptorales bacterium]